MIAPTAIRNLQPGQVLRDDVVTGLEVRCFANSRTAYYVWFRTKLGKARHPKLGDTAVMTLADARKAAKDMLLVVANGGDPIADRNNVKRSPDMADLWDKFWQLRAKNKKSAASDQRMWDKIIAPKFKATRVRAFSFEDMVDFHRAMADTPYQANRVKQLLSAMFTFAERPLKWREVNSNPCRGVESYPEHSRRRFAKPDELKRIAEELEKELAHAATINRRQEREIPQYVAFIYLLIYTGARPGEIQFAKREWLHALADGAGVLRLPDSKTGQRDVYLPPQAMAILAKLPEFPDGTICGCAQPVHLWRRIRARAKCPDLRLYPDLRRSFATVAMASGQPVSMVSALLGHKTTQTTLIYARLMEEAAVTSVSTAANAMAGLLQGNGKADVGPGVEQPGGADGQVPVEELPGGDQRI